MGKAWESAVGKRGRCSLRLLAAVASLLALPTHFPFPIPLLPTTGVLHAQSADARIRQQRDELERIRQERQALERQMRELQSTAHDLTEEVAERRACGVYIGPRL